MNFIKKDFFIYGLYKEGENIFYIGITDCIESRHRDHKRTFGGATKIQVLDTYYGELRPACALEEFWIKDYRSRGYVLENKTGANLMLLGVKCLECGNEVPQILGKRKKLYCGSSCRSNHFQKKKRLIKDEEFFKKNTGNGVLPKREMSEEAKLAAAISKNTIAVLSERWDIQAQIDKLTTEMDAIKEGNFGTPLRNKLLDKITKLKRQL